MTAPSITGSIAQYQDSTQNPAGVSITVPADATLCLVCAVFYRGTANVDFSSLTLGGAAFSLVIRNYGPTSGDTATIWRLVNPATGSQTLDWAWSDSLTEGANIFVVFLKDVDTSTPITGTGSADAGSTTTVTTGAIPSSTNDLGLCVVYSYGTTDANAAPTGAGQTEVADSTVYNSCQGAVGTKPGATSSITMQGYGDWVTVAACSIAGTAGSGSQIKKLAGVAQASVKVAAGVAAASIKKVAGVSNA